MTSGTTTPRSNTSKPSIRSPQNSRTPSPSVNPPQTRGRDASSKARHPDPSAVPSRSYSKATTGGATSKGPASSWGAKATKMLHRFHRATEAFPPLHAAIEDIVSCLPTPQGATISRSDHEELAIGLGAMVAILIHHLHEATPEVITDSIRSILEDIRGEIESISGRRSRDPHGRVPGAINDEEDLIRRYRRIEQLFRQLQVEVGLRTLNINTKHFVNTQLESLRPVKSARYSSDLSLEVGRRACTENTRIKVLEDILKS